MFYSVHTKQGADDDAPKTMRVDYKVGWHSTSRSGSASSTRAMPARRPIAWWQRRSPDPVPPTRRAGRGTGPVRGCRGTSSITVRTVAGEPYERIVDYELGEIPEAVPAELAECRPVQPDDVPF